jgi:hypothetical protein
MPVPAEVARRAPKPMLDVWSAFASIQVRWYDEQRRLGRDATGGGLVLLAPRETLDEIETYAMLLDDERDDPNEHYELAARTWGAWTPFHRFPSGDSLALNETGAVTVWQHDLLDGGPYVHGLVLGPDLLTFLEAWARVCWAEPRDWRYVVTDEAELDWSAGDWKLFG